MSNKWYTLQEKWPQTGDFILAELDDCKIATHMTIKVREGEGFGHIKRWKYCNPPEESFKFEKPITWRDV